MTDFAFELDAGRTCLDFANTHDSAGEHLNSYADLVAFAAQSHLLNPDDARWLQAEGLRDPLRADGVMLRARRLRAAIYAMFSAVAAGQTPREYDVEQLNFELAATLTHARILPVTDTRAGREAQRDHADAGDRVDVHGSQDAGGRADVHNTRDGGDSTEAHTRRKAGDTAAAEVSYRWGWVGRNMDAPLWGVSRSAADLLTTDDDLRRVRECGGAECRWLFMDTSKNRTRQWCSMRSCGNREKARRHYARSRTPQSATEGLPS
jgi:predicted RNA-binding Zn ribbon-like protein